MTVSSRVKKVVLVGDNPEDTIGFLRTFLNEKSLIYISEGKQQKNNLMITVISSNSISDDAVEKDEAGDLTIKSSDLPFGVMLVAFLGNDEWISIIPDDVELVLFLKGYPYESQSLCQKIRLINDFISSNLELGLLGYRIVVFKEEKRLGSTDKDDSYDIFIKSIDRINNVLSEDKNISKIVDFKLYNDKRNIYEILLNDHNATEYFNTISSKKIDSWIQQIESEKLFLTLGGFFINPTEQNEMQANIFGYNKVKTSTNLLQTYISRYKESSLFSMIENTVIEKYDDWINDICFWDIKADKRNLKNNITERYKITMDKLMEKKPKAICCPDTAEEYHQIIAQNDIDILFTNAVNQFVNEEMVDLLISTIHRKQNILANYLNK